MTTQELPQLVAHYRAGLEAEMTLLHRLESLAAARKHMGRRQRGERVSGSPPMPSAPRRGR